jgi:branched-chain amino acid transport system substrate-binding protein
VLTALTLTGCADQPDAATGPPERAVPVAPPAATGDGVLRIGTLFSSTGSFAAYADAQVAGVELAVRELNAAGGFGGHAVEVFHRNAGDGGAPAAEELRQLVEKNVDVIVGPSSTAVATGLLAEPAAERVLLFAAGFVDAGNAESVEAAGLFRTVAETGTPTRGDGAFLARLATVDPGLLDTTFAAETYDATLAAALAAAAAGDDGAASVAWALPEVTVGGFGCTSLGVCLEAIAASVDVDYGGVSGPLDVFATGSGAGGTSSGADSSTAES